jgi:predicted GNAT family acetyltransferase
MCEDDRNQVLSLLTNSFFPDEPVARCLHITDTLEFAQSVIHDFLKERCSFIAYDTTTNQIVGCYLNEIVHRNVQHETSELDEKIRFMFQIFDDLKNKLNIFDRLNTDTLIHICVLSVDRTVRGHGLAPCLISKSIEYVKELKLQGAFAVATNVYSLNSDYNPERL